MKSEIQLIRHATLRITLRNVSIIVDPMFSDKNEMEPIQNSGNQIQIPMVDLPFDRHILEEMIAHTDIILVTHLHRDHWDKRAQELIPKSKIIFCQPGDDVVLRSQGFTEVHPIENTQQWNGINLTRTSGQHGRDEIGKKMGPVSGFIIQSPYQRIYIAGDTIWCDEVNYALLNFHPDYTVVNAGRAQFIEGDPITMSAEDVYQVCQHAPFTTVIAVHMDTINHCQLSRENLRDFTNKINLISSVKIPYDGETIVLQ
jgi:Predicted Zn-dependent hydrolases of the beta-lactamase fold